MSLLGLCDNDPLINTLREVFDCNPIRVPEGRVLPLTVVASDGTRSYFRGELAPLLAGSPLLPISTATTDMANLSVKRTGAVKIDLGLKILEGFLSGFGIPASGIKVRFDGATEVSFAFNAVQRQYIDVNLLGKLLSRYKVDRKSPAASIFFQGGFDFLVLDSVIQSRDFDINVEKKRDDGFALDIPTIQQIVDKANVGVAVTSASVLDISFKGPKYLTFAFSCVRLYLNENGLITSMPPADKVPALSSYLSTGRHLIQYTPDRVLLSPKPALVSFDS